MNQFTESVTSFWDFLWPALVNLVLIVVIMLYLAPKLKELVSRIANSLTISKFLSLLQSKTAESLGIPKLVPIITLFLAMLVLVVVKDVTFLVGAKSPPVIMYTSPNQYIALNSEQNLLKIWGQLPEESSLMDLSRFIDNAWNEKTVNTGTEFWGRREGAASVYEYHLKFYIVVAILSAILSIYLKGDVSRTVPKLFKVLGLLLFFYGITVLYTVHAHSKFIEGKVQYMIDSYSFEEGSSSNSEELNCLRRGRLAGYLDGNVSWWSLGLPSWAWF